MGLFDMLRRGGRQAHHVVGRISDEPKIIGENGTKYLVFRISEAPDTEFRLRILPTTPKRRKGDRVELTWTQAENGIAVVETLYSAPDHESVRLRNETYLRGIQSQDTKQH